MGTGVRAGGGSGPQNPHPPGMGWGGVGGGGGVQQRRIQDSGKGGRVTVNTKTWCICVLACQFLFPS